MPVDLTLAALVFVLAHRLISGSRIRGLIVGRVGEKAFQVAFSLLSVALTIWLVWAYVAGTPERPSSAPALVGLAGVLAFLSCYLLAAGLTTRNPTIAGLGRALRAPDAVHGVIVLTRHPFLMGIVMLSVAHLVVLRELADWIFFGTLAFVAVTGMHSIDRKRALAFGAEWEAFRSRTSIIPGAVLFSGHQGLRWADIGWLRPLLGALLFLVAVALHDMPWG